MALILVIFLFLAIKLVSKNELSDEDYGYKFEKTDSEQENLTSNEN